MLTDNKEISTAEYWDSLYRGERNDKPVDSSNGVRPPKSFDRFDIVVKLITENDKKIIGVGSGHARIEARIKAKYPNAFVLATDQSEEAIKAANYQPYLIASAYHLPFSNKNTDVLICTQALEYMEFQDKALIEFKRVSKKFICTIPLNEMSKWSQLFIYNEESFCKWLSTYGTIEIKENYGELLLVKLKFNE